jgi:hypothetical protein
MALHDLLQGVALLYYVCDVPASPETTLWACTACYGDSRSLMYVKTMKREKWVVVRDTTGGVNRIYHRF